jgi:DNA-binding XRE family transcriptional regulator
VVSDPAPKSFATPTQFGGNSFGGNDMEESAAPEAARANLVRALREERMLSREEPAKRARVSLRTIWSVEAGHECRLETKRSILRALHISRAQHRVVFPARAREAAPRSALMPERATLRESASVRSETA